MVIERGAISAAAQVDEIAEAGGEVGIVGHQSAALPRRKHFAVLKTERTPAAEAARAFSSPLGPVGVGGVLVEVDAVALGDVRQGVHVGQGSTEVDGDDAFGARPDRLFDATRAQVEAVRLDVDKDRGGADAGDRGGRRDKGNGGHDHFVARPQFFHGEGRLQRNRAVHHGDAVLAVLEFGELLLEIGGERVESAPLWRGQHGAQQFYFTISCDRPVGYVHPIF